MRKDSTHLHGSVQVNESEAQVCRISEGEWCGLVPELCYINSN